MKTAHTKHSPYPKIIHVKQVSVSSPGDGLSPHVLYLPGPLALSRLAHTRQQTHDKGFVCADRRGDGGGGLIVKIQEQVGMLQSEQTPKRL